MKGILPVVLGLLMAAVLPTAGLAQGKANREADMTRTMRSILSSTRDPKQVAGLLQKQGARFLGYQETNVAFVFDGKQVLPQQSTVKTVGADLIPVAMVQPARGEIRPTAGDKADLTLTMWLYEWRNWDGTYTEQAVISGYWRSTEYSWIDNPADVIDVRWIVGDVVYTSSTPFDGVQRDQHTNGIASFTVDDQVASWDLYVNFKPVSAASHGKWTNIFANYTHTWWSIGQNLAFCRGTSGLRVRLSRLVPSPTWGWYHSRQHLPLT